MKIHDQQCRRDLLVLPGLPAILFDIPRFRCETRLGRRNHQYLQIGVWKIMAKLD